MEQATTFALSVGLSFPGACLMGWLCFFLARRKGRDSLGWFLNGFLPGLGGLLVLGFFVTLALHRQSGWDSMGWVSLGAILTLQSPLVLLTLPALENPEPNAAGRATHPLRRFYLALFLLLCLVLLVFGFIGYFFVPDQHGYRIPEKDFGLRSQSLGLVRRTGVHLRASLPAALPKSFSESL